MPPSDEQRPDPDLLLAHLMEHERQAARGRLRIYFGACAGVGKTYAMLAAAQKLSATQRDIVVGVVETHGRSETATLLQGLEILPLKAFTHREKTLKEFDIDAALQRHPSLILVDELAHTNAQGARHPKRWQDVDELLRAGIDVFTTVNVQHLESLNDIVGGIIGIHVSETLPDTVFDRADEIVLVDLPADELLKRLKEGKVYQAGQADLAAQNFFRKGNLIALRELALRRTAERIENDVQAYRIEKSIEPIWKTDTALLVCTGPRPGAEHLIRSAAQMAGQLNAPWHALYIETPALQGLPSSQREAILRTLKLAQELGATTTVLSGNNIAASIVDYAHSHNLSRVVLGRATPGFPWHMALSRRIAAQAPEIDLIEIGRAAPGDTDQPSETHHAGAGVPHKASRLPYLWAMLASLSAALLATPLLPYLDPANIVMLFLLTIVLVALRWGRGPAALASFISVAAFDFFFVPPRLSLAVGDIQYIVTFIVMLAVGLTVGQLTAGLRYQTRIARQRESRSRALYEFARELSSALQIEQIFDTTRNVIRNTFSARTMLLLPDRQGRLQPVPLPPDSDTPQLESADMSVAQWAFDHALAAGASTDTLPANRFFYLPLVAPMRTRGVLAISLQNRRQLLIPEQRQQLEVFAALAAIALERVHYIDVAQNALVRIESERLRNSLLSALSHDLRTPLTSLRGLSESLIHSDPSLTPAQQALAMALHDETLRMSGLVTNLLDMARLQSGEIKLNLQWQSFEEIVGSALRASGLILARYTVRTRIARELPLLRFDAILIERVLCNLIENACKYTPPGSTITITAGTAGAWLEVVVRDDGPGLPLGREELVFEKFMRGDPESATPGVGLGLTICRAIIEAHHGTISAKSLPTQGGAAITFTLPLGTPPAQPEPDEEPTPAPSDH